jgi:DNA-binding MarR family transcriptional regulator
MTTNWLTDEQQRAWRGLVQMTAQLEARLNRELQDSFGLSLTDYHVLVALSEAPDTRLRSFEIAEILDWEQSRLSHHLSRMQRRGLLDREPCRTDGRGAFVVLTDAGRTAIEQAAPTHVNTVRRLVFDGLSPDHLAALTAITAQVLERLHPQPAEPDQPASHAEAAGPPT